MYSKFLYAFEVHANMIELISIVGLIVGVAIGYIAAKVLKIAIIIGLIILILAYLGITVFSRGQLEGFLRAIMPVL